MDAKTPRDSIIDVATQFLAASNVLEDRTEVRFKFICPACKEPMCFHKANTIYSQTACVVCGHDFDVEIIGFVYIWKKQL